MEDLGFKIFVAVITVLVNATIICAMACGEEPDEKTAQSSSSKWKWARAHAEVIDESYDEVVTDPDPVCFQDVANRKTGKSRNTTARVDVLKFYRVRYSYENCRYEAKITGYTVKRNCAEIYCRKDNPKIAKEFIPVPSWTVETSIAALFVVAMSIFFEIMAFM